MPASLKLAEAFGEDLALIFVECQGTTIDEAESFAYSRLWMGTHAMWTTERPFDTGSRGLPNFALLSIEGEVLLKGHPGSLHGKIEEAIRQEISKAAKGPDEVPKSLKGAWKEFGKGQYARAVASARKAAEQEGDESEAAAETAALFEERIESKIRRAEWMMENGYYLEAEERIGKLAKGVSGLEELEARVKELSARLASQELRQEVAAAKSFAKIEKKVLQKGMEKGLASALKKFIEKQEGTKAALRAAHLLKVTGES